MTPPRSMTDMLVRASEIAPAGYALAFHVDQMRPSFLLHAYPIAWTTIYARKALVMADPVVAWGLSQEGVCRWADLTEDPSGVMALASENGLKFGCVCSVGTAELRTFGGFARSDREFTSDEIEELSAILSELQVATLSAKDLSEEAKQELLGTSIRYSKV